MKIIGIILIIVGAIGIIVGCVTYKGTGIAATIGSLTGLISGIGFILADKKIELLSNNKDS
ncbi:hypothetical protein [Clostridium luticellarii]|jgi:hypothetical protein|uniref:Uncharacterized protein n=1 Tax=Clostridium luticellarii TaxID=1691940 RepID=A0A2T0BHC7_9CLOT|nr:hypothetical protein [Clostridium luticellarii]MCI1969720.1 hypothetical protein [Clostridium luticellarii]MCI2039833.1 hypothetical protein [Clostridium luticellarii]PRR83212.1 hypothetical protein CLLU_26800 [Clostridium luticellarii]